MRYLIPIASRDELFPRKEFHFPKPLIEINNVPMIEHVIASIRMHDVNPEFIFVVNRQDCIEFSLDKVLEFSAGPSCVVVQLEKPTAGALCSCLMAVDYINDDQPLVVMNGDQVIDTNIDEVITYFQNKSAGAGVLTFESVHPRWSYVKTDRNGDVLETAEKRVLSRRAIAGFYYYSRGQSFVAAAKRVILNNQSLNGVFYISPTINQMILMGEMVAYHDIGENCYHSFYSPQRIEYYQKKFTTYSLSQVLPSKGLQVVIPMAGLGSRFSNAGYSKPKPFIDVLGKTMIEQVMDNLGTSNSRFILIARSEHLDAEAEVRDNLEAFPNVSFSPIDFVTEGAACTVLTARRQLDLDAPLLTANCDQIVDFNCSAFIQDAIDRGLDGSILVFRDENKDPKWSFARTNAEGFVEEVREKVAISDLATVGLYYFKRASDFVFNAIDMIAKNDRVNNEFYVCPVYNYLIKDGKKIGVYFVKAEDMHGIGTPDDLNAYINLKLLSQ